MLTTVIVLSALFYSSSVYLELVSALSRPAGALIGKNSMGYTTHGLISTFKRIFMVLYPPCIGIVATIGDVSDVYLSIYICFIASIAGLILSTLTRRRLLSLQLRFIHYFSSGNSFINSLYLCLTQEDYQIDAEIDRIQNRESFEFNIFFQLKHIDWSVCFLCCYVISFYSIAIFAINIIALHFSQYDSILYQLVGIVNAFGTLIWAFVLDPKLSRRFDHCERVMEVSESIFLGNWLAHLVLAPFLITCLILVLEL